MEYNILSCGAVADGRTNCATAIQNAVDTASAAGGGRVIIPAGPYQQPGPCRYQTVPPRGKRREP